MRVKQLVREHPHLELERELQRLTEDLELEREGRTHNHRERQRLGEELERERRARSGDQRNVQRPRARSSGGAAGSQASEEVLMAIPFEKQQPLGHHRGSLSVTGTPFGMRKMGGALAHCTTDT
jgi:hypothetical protein